MILHSWTRSTLQEVIVLSFLEFTGVKNVKFLVASTYKHFKQQPLPFPRVWESNFKNDCFFYFILLTGMLTYTANAISSDQQQSVSSTKMGIFIY